MRVMFVIHYPVFGGPHNQALRLAANLQDLGWETVVVLPEGSENAASRLSNGGVEVVTTSLHRLRASVNPGPHLGLLATLVPEIRELRRIIRERGIDVVQIGGLVNPHAAIAARLERVPVVWQILDTRAPRVVAAIGMVLVDALADVIMSTGRTVLLSHPGGRRLLGRCVTYFPPVDVELFRPRPEAVSEVRKEWGVPAEASVIGCVANINPQKGIVPLIGAFVRVRDVLPKSRLVLVGADYATQTGYTAQVRAALKQSGLIVGRDVVFVGERPDVHRQLAGMDVFAFSPSRRGEGITTAILEAMSAGLPVVTTSVGGIPEAVEDGVTGILVPADGGRPLADAIVAVLQDPSAARRIGAAARRRAIDRFGLSACAETHVTAYERATTRERVHEAKATDRPQRTLEAVVVCPSCRGGLTIDRVSMTCRECTRAYPVIDGIPVLLIDDASGADVAHGHKAAQSHHSDETVDLEFEVTRPHGTAGLYRFLLLEKFRRGTSPMRQDLSGATALTVCGGSGMDAEFLARSGAAVVSSDISLGAARRARERAQRYGLNITVCVADAENLPFADATFDLVYVHDGLHHLERPDHALRDMARVARRWVSITEPARAFATSVAVRVGLALDREEAGNDVVRLSPDEIVAALTAVGYRPLTAHRYAMYYKHEPGTIVNVLSLRWTLPLARFAWRVGNFVIGRFGNKMVVVAERRTPVADRGELSTSVERGRRATSRKPRS
jgi:glycosyltransferase involved in cell wall biosynthesis/SAM-dependent methyltransferase